MDPSLYCRLASWARLYSAQSDKERVSGHADDFNQNGQDERGWRGSPFYWPVIMAQQNIRTAIFTHETMG